MLALRLALADLSRDRVHLLCGAALVAGVLAPLLILVAVKIGVARTLIAELRDDPAKREVFVGGNASLPPSLVAEIADWPETGFVAPRTRSQSSDVQVTAQGAGRVLAASMTPSGPGDPVLGAAPVPEALRVALSAELADRLGVAAPGRVRMVAQRYAPTRRAVPLDLEVAAVLPPGAVRGRQIMTDPATMDAIEAFYDGYAALGVDEGTPLEDRATAWESLRLYAVDLAAVAPLEARIEARLAEAGADVDAISSAAEIEATVQLDANLNLALAVVVGAATVGLFAAMVSSFWAGVERKRATLSLLALQGASPATLAALPVIQALVTAALGAALALAVFAGGARVAQALFADRLGGGSIVVLPPGIAAATVAAVLGLAALAALAAALAAQRADPAETLRGRA